MIDGTFTFLAAGAMVMNIAAVTTLRPIFLPKTEDFFTVHSIEATRQGDTAVLKVNRAILKPIHLAYTVKVFADTADGLEPFCTAKGGPYQYQPRAQLPDPITLSWWTDGACDVLPDGPAQIITTWTPTDDDLDPITKIAKVE